MVDVKLYHSKEQFIENLRQFDVCSNPYESYAFMSIFMDYNDEGNYYFFDIYEDGEKIAMAPFVCTFESKLFKIKKFRFVGYRQFNYEQYICRDGMVKRVHEIFMDYLEGQKYKSIINFYDINESSELFNVLSESPFKKISLKLYQCPFLHFTDTFDEFFKEVYPSSKKRTELKKFQRKLGEIGDFRIVNVEDEKSYKDNIQYINQIYRIHAERFSGVYATSFFGAESMRSYYSALIQKLMQYEKGYISLLLMDDVVIAFIFCLTNGKTLIDWIPAFDPAYSHYSIGIVQYKMLFEEMCNPSVKYTMFDYSKGSSVYKRKWAKQETTNYQFLERIGSPSLILNSAFWIDKMRFSFKVFLREKGILSKCKHILGSVLSLLNNEKKQTSESCVKIINKTETTTSFDFKYSMIRDLSVETRSEVLLYLYKGYSVLSIHNIDGKYEIYMSEN